MLGIFVDTETNGLNPFKHCILEIAIKITDLLTHHTVASYEAIVQVTEKQWQLSCKESLHINGFTYEQTKKGKSSTQVSQDIQDLLKKNNVQRGTCFFICQNPSFDRMFFAQLLSPELQESLNWPYHWLDLASMYWAISLPQGRKNPACYPWATGISKNKIAAVYGIPPENFPHRAMHGVDHLIACYEAVIN